MGKIFIGVALILIIAFGGYFLFNNLSKTTGNVVAGNEVNTFAITGDHLRFFIGDAENPDIRVKQGDRVRIEFVSTEGFHDWALDEFGAATERVNPGTQTSIEFVADRKGTFEYYCSVGKHRANGMKGKFIVE